MKRLTFPSILRRSLTHRRARSISALVALTVSAAVATALLTLYADLNAKLHKEFRNFGANVVVTIPSSALKGLDFSPAIPPCNETRLQPLRDCPPTLQSPSLSLAQIQKAAGPDALVAPFAYAVAITDRGTSVVVAGTDFPAVQRLDAWWDLAHWPTAPDAALLGDRAANFIADEHAVKLTYANKAITLTGAGLIKTGGDEDSRIYIPLSAFTQWTGVSPTVIEIQIPGGAAAVEAALTRLRAQFPTLQIQPVRQLVEGESRIVDRTHSLMYSSVLLIALTVAVSVLATLSASVLERRRDFALMKALGGSQTQLMALFLFEALVLALAGVVLGYIAGCAAAWAISQANFHTATLPRLSVLPLVLLLNITIAAFAALFPVRVLRGLQPAALLKGE